MSEASLSWPDRASEASAPCALPDRERIDQLECPAVPRFNSLEPRLHVADFNHSLAFYRDTLGFEVLRRFPRKALPSP